MKTFNFIAKIIITVLFAGAFLFSCSAGAHDGKGLLSITLPGNSARALSETYLNSLRYRLVFTGKSEETRNASAGQTVTIPLAEGEWKIAVTVFNTAGKQVGEGSGQAAVTIGAVTNVKIPIFIESDGYLGDSLNLAGQVVTITNKPFTSSGSMTLSSNGEGTGTISPDGKFNFKIGVPNTLSVLDMQLFDDWAISISQNNVNAALLELITENDLSINRIKIINENRNEGVFYLYVDKDVSITFREIYSSASDTSEREKILALKKGWNAIFVVEEKSQTKTELSFSISNPDHLQWVVDYDDRFSIEYGAWPSKERWAHFGLDEIIRQDRSSTCYYLINDERLTVMLSGERYEDILSQFQNNNVLSGGEDIDDNSGDVNTIGYILDSYTINDRKFVFSINEYSVTSTDNLYLLSDLLEGIYNEDKVNFSHYNLVISDAAAIVIRIYVKN